VELRESFWKPQGYEQDEPISLSVCSSLQVGVVMPLRSNVAMCGDVLGSCD
jgi:hypothetical protein